MFTFCTVEALEITLRENEIKRGANFMKPSQPKKWHPVRKPKHSGSLRVVRLSALGYGLCKVVVSIAYVFAEQKNCRRLY